MRKLMVERLEKLRESSNNFSGKEMRWRDMRINGWALWELDWGKLDDEELLEAFERILKRYYAQM